MPRIRFAALIAAATIAAPAFARQPATPPHPPAKPPAAPEPTPAKADALDAAHRAKAQTLIDKAEAYLRSTQDKETGGWSLPKPDKDGKTPPTFPGITGLALIGLASNPKASPDDPTIDRGTKFLLSFQQKDGGIYDRMLPSYNTSLAVSALSKVDTPKAREAMKRAVEFLRQLQWSEDSSPEVGGSEAPKPITRDHIFYGGVGYGRHGRPDNSNLMMFMQALQDAGVSPGDEAVKRALVFLRRTQMDDRVNDMPFAKGSRQGGFIYATTPDAASVEKRPGDSEAESFEETLSDGTKASRLRAYGTMTYAGFKSYVYAELPKDDPRVQYAFDWIRRNYSTTENPGIGDNGLYYYYLVFSRALNAWGEPTISMLDDKNKPTGKTANWRHDLIDRLAALQQEDGSFKSVNPRWMENNPDLITGYALIALRQCVD